MATNLTISEVITKVANEPRRIRIGDVSVDNHSIKDLVAALQSGTSAEVISDPANSTSTSVAGLTTRKIVPV